MVSVKGKSINKIRIHLVYVPTPLKKESMDLPVKMEKQWLSSNGKIEQPPLAGDIASLHQEREKASSTGSADAIAVLPAELMGSH